MPNNCFNKITVYGNRNELTQFKNNVADDGTVFSLFKIKPVPKDIIDFETWAIENWGINRLPLYANLTDKKECLFYEIVTAYVPPVRIFSALFDKYPNYDFEIYCWEEFNQFNYEVDFKNGKVTKTIKRCWELEPFDNSKSKVLTLVTLEDDYLNETAKIVEEKIYDNDRIPQILGLE